MADKNDAPKWNLQEDINLVDKGYKSGYKNGHEDGVIKGEANAKVEILEAKNKALKQEVRAEKAERQVAELKLQIATQNV